MIDTGPGAAAHAAVSRAEGSQPLLSRRRLLVALALTAFTISWLALLGFRGLFNPDEGRYAEIPREMLASGDWVVPRLNGLVYIEKPPLQYWATAVTYALFGTSVWTARLYTGLTGLATVLATAWLALRLWGAAAAWRSGIMLATSLLVVLMSHQLTLDMSLTLFTTLTLAGFCLAQNARTAEACHMQALRASAVRAFCARPKPASVSVVKSVRLMSRVS